MVRTIEDLIQGQARKVFPFKLDPTLGLVLLPSPSSPPHLALALLRQISIPSKRHHSLLSISSYAPLPIIVSLCAAFRSS